MGIVLIGRSLDEIKDDIFNNRIGPRNFLEGGLEEIDEVVRYNREEVDIEVLETAKKNYFAILEFLKELLSEGTIRLESKLKSNSDYAYFFQQYTNRADDIFNSVYFRRREDLAETRAKSKSRIEYSHRSDNSGIKIISLNPNIRAKFEFK